MHDFHVHSNYSDGRFLPVMVRAATEAGLGGVGVADHCIVSNREAADDARTKWGFDLDRTYERRRRGIEQVRESADIAVYDAVEMNYDPRDEAAIREFLDGAAFDYSIGSVHEVEGLNVQDASNFRGMSDDERDAVVDAYFDRFLDVLLDHDVSLTVGTDSHAPGEIGERAEFLQEFAADRDIDTVGPRR